MIISVGQYVDVQPQARRGRRNSQGGRAVVRGVEQPPTPSAEAASTAPPSRLLYDVRYVLGGLSQNVEESRLSPATLDTTARKRGRDEPTRPSLLSASYAPPRPNEEADAAPQQKKRSTIPGTTSWLIAAAEVSGKPAYNGESKAVFSLRKKKREKEPGWLRQLESSVDSSSSPTGHLSEVERRKVLSLLLAVQVNISAAPLVAFAWGVSKQTVYALRTKALESNDLSIKRKPRKDKGTSIFTSDARRDATFTVQHAHSKLYRKKHEDGVPVTQKLVSEAFASASPGALQRARTLATSWRNQAPFLESEVKRVLMFTRGAVSWAVLATQVAGSGSLQPICTNTIRVHVMGLPDSTYRTTRILPHLNRGCILRRYNWSMEFWLFWESAKRFNGVQLVVVHMDEKWFWAVVVRKHLKYIPYLGVEPVIHGVQHKSHIDKTMGIASTAFIPFNNDMEKGGGRALKVNLVRVGRMVPAEKDTYRRVYRNDGSYHYPKRPESILRRKGQDYFKGMEITGSKDGSTKKPKFSLLRFYNDVELPKLDQIAAELEAETGKRVCIRYQMDGAGPHTDARLLESLDEEFSRRNWIVKFQPSNSPLTNVKDACLFPALSKAVSREQGISRGGTLFQGEELWAAVKKAWKEFPLDTIARSYIGHHQVVNAIAHCKGDDTFTREHNSFHCNVRKCCIPLYGESGKTIGVEVVTSEEGAANVRQFKYAKPDVSSVDPSQLNLQELSVLLEGLPVAGPLWEAFAIAYDVKLQQEEDE